jgi:hypothetical protein
MKARRLLCWLGLFCMAVLVLMPDITVNAQPDPGGQGSDRQIPIEVEGEGPDTKTPAERQASDDPTMKSYWTEERRREQEQRKKEVEQSLLEAGCQIESSRTVRYGGVDQRYNKYECPAGFTVEGLYREAEQSLIEYDCQYTKTWTGPMVVDRLEVVDDTVWKLYECPPDSKFGDGGPYGGHGKWRCLVSPGSIKETDWFVKKTDWGVDSVPLYVANGEVRSGECVPPLGQGEIRGPKENDQPSRGINIEQIREPAASDSQGESDQQQAQSGQQQANGEEAQGEENNASNQSQENGSSKQGYGCSANP